MLVPDSSGGTKGTVPLCPTEAGSDHIDHVRTQLPYALTVALVSGVFGFIPVGFGMPYIVSLLLGVAALYLIVSFAGKRVPDAPVGYDKNITA